MGLCPKGDRGEGDNIWVCFFFEGRQKAFARFLLDEGKKKHTWACLQVRHREYQGHFHYAKNTTVCNGPCAHSPQGVQNDIFKVCF
jgi:hypothetical protein